MEMEAMALKLEVAALCLEVQASCVKEEVVMVAHQADHQKVVVVCWDGVQGQTNPWHRRWDNNYWQ